MANSLYYSTRQLFLEGSLDMRSVTTKCLLTTSGYVPDLAADKFVSAIGSGYIVGRSPALTSVSTTAGTFTADPVTFSTLTGLAVFSVVIYADSGSDSTSRLIAMIETALGLPFTPNGGDFEVIWNASGIFQL